MFVLRESNKEVNTNPKTKEPPKPKESVDENLTEVTYTVRTNPEGPTSEPGSPHHQEDNQKVCAILKVIREVEDIGLFITLVLKFS